MCLEVERWENEGGQPLTPDVEMKPAQEYKSHTREKQEVNHEYAYIRKGKDQK